MENNEVLRAEEKRTDSWEDALQKESWVAPAVNIYETADGYSLMANMPGVSRENVKIKLEDGDLIIMGKIGYVDQIKRKYLLNETEIGNYYRKFRISETIDESKIEAKLENGQLIVDLPKHERVKPKSIEIK